MQPTARNLDHLEALRREQYQLTRRLTEVKLALRENGVTKNAVQFIPHKVEPARLARRGELVEEQLALEGRLRAVKESIKEHTGGRDTLFDVLAESLTAAQLAQLQAEARRRRLGYPPTRVVLEPSDTQDQLRALRTLCEGLLGHLEAARTHLTEVIQEGCHRWGNAAFLRLISPVNTKLPPLEDLDRLKRIHHLK